MGKLPHKVMLLVEDNPDDMEFALLALRDNGLNGKVVVARDGQEALDYLFSGNDRPGFVLLDLKMPRVDGFEVLRQMRANDATNALPVVILSSSNEECDLEACYKLGANSYVQKSLDFSKFTESIKQIGHYWLDLNEVPGSCHPA
ncbi:MAG: response regulator [Burkholderiales bacterium]